jgi:hypothetical protein
VKMVWHDHMPAHDPSLRLAPNFKQSVVGRSVGEPWRSVTSANRKKNDRWTTRLDQDAMCWPMSGVHSGVHLGRNRVVIVLQCRIFGSLALPEDARQEPRTPGRRSAAASHSPKPLGGSLTLPEAARQEPRTPGSRSAGASHSRKKLSQADRLTKNYSLPESNSMIGRIPVAVKHPVDICPTEEPVWSRLTRASMSGRGSWPP